MTLRDGTDADLLAFARVFTDAIRAAGPAGYAPHQVAAWSATADDPEAFGRRLLAARTFVAEDDRGLAGFSALDPDGRIAMLYVRGDRQRQGLGMRLLRAALGAAEEAGATRAYAEASTVALPLFERAGFVETGVEVVHRGGVRFDRHLVERRLGTAG